MGQKNTCRCSSVIAATAPSLSEVPNEKSALTSAINAERSPKSKQENEWPRITKQNNTLNIKPFRYRYGNLKRGETIDEDEMNIRGMHILTWYATTGAHRRIGRIWSLRKAGGKLVFLDIVQDGALLQCLCNYRNIGLGDSNLEEFENFPNDLHRGDIISRVPSTFPME